MEQQLSEAGFTQVEGAEGLFQRLFKFERHGYKNDVNVIAVVKDGKLGRLLQESKDRYHDTALIDRMGYTITGVVDVERFEGFKQSVLKAENEAMTFDISEKGEIQNVSLKREAAPDELGVVPFPEKQEPSGFVIGGKNSTETVRNLQAISGQPIWGLEGKMRPALNRDLRPTGGVSMAGFLGPQERLLDVLAQDNDFVQSQGLTHQELAAQLKYAREIYFKLGVKEFTYHGRKYGVSLQQWRGFQESPFDDGTRASSDIMITNLDTGKTLGTSLFAPRYDRAIWIL